MIWHFSAAVDHPGISFGHAGREFRKQLETLVEVADDPEDADIQIYFGLPLWHQRRLWRKRSRMFLWYTVTETTKVNPRYVREINNSHGLLTPSRFAADVYRDNGVERPIFVVHHGIDPERFRFIDRREPSKCAALNWPDAFTFLWQGVKVRWDRKNGGMVEDAFCDLDLKDAWLIEKGAPWPSPAGSVLDRKARIWRYYGYLPEDQLDALDSLCDCFVWPTRGEAFGMIPLEKMATGMPTIVTDWSGCSEYVDDRYCLPLRNLSFGTAVYNECTPYSRIDWGRDARIDMDELREKMRWVYEHRDEAYEMGKRASEYVRTKWTWDGRVREQIRKVVEFYS